LHTVRSDCAKVISDPGEIIKYARIIIRPEYVFFGSAKRKGKKNLNVLVESQDFNGFAFSLLEGFARWNIHSQKVVK
jgi:hypothetical protein